MKKKLLFIMPSLSAGGGEKSLINLLSQIDYDHYDVDLFLLNHEGLFMEFVPEEVNILPLPEDFQIFSYPLFQSVKELSLKGKPAIAMNRFVFTIKNRLVKNIARREQYNWSHLSKSLSRLDKKYDVAIGFLEKTSTYFCVDKVDAAKKIGWVHIDYDNLGMDPKIDTKYFDELDNIITVSEECASILKKRFPSQKDKVDVIYNIVSPKLINQLAALEDQDVYGRKKDEIVILSIGRLHYQKSFQLAIESCRLLLNKGYNVQWNIIGEGEEREKLTRLIQTNRLEKHFKLLGLKANPYPYIKQADIYVQTSKFEGKSIAIDEAKILNKPIVLTDFSTAKDQIQSGKEGLIVEMSPEAIVEGIEKLINDRGLTSLLTSTLSKLKLGTEDEIQKLYQLMNEESRCEKENIIYHE